MMLLVRVIGAVVYRPAPCSVMLGVLPVRVLRVTALLIRASVGRPFPTSLLKMPPPCATPLVPVAIPLFVFTVVFRSVRLPPLTIPPPIVSALPDATVATVLFPVIALLVMVTVLKLKIAPPAAAPDPEVAVVRALLPVNTLFVIDTGLGEARNSAPPLPPTPPAPVATWLVPLALLPLNSVLV